MAPRITQASCSLLILKPTHAQERTRSHEHDCQSPGSSLVQPDRLPIAVRAYRHRRLESRSEEPTRKKRSGKPAPPPNGRSFSTPKQPSMRPSGCASAHISSAKATNWTKPGSSMIRRIISEGELSLLRRVLRRARTQVADRRRIRRRSAVSRGPMIFAPPSLVSICRSTSRGSRSSTARLAARRCEAASRSSCRGSGGGRRSRFAISMLAPR